MGWAAQWWPRSPGLGKAYESRWWSAWRVKQLKKEDSRVGVCGSPVDGHCWEERPKSVRASRAEELEALSTGSSQTVLQLAVKQGGLHRAHSDKEMVVDDEVRKEARSDQRAVFSPIQTPKSSFLLCQPHDIAFADLGPVPGLPNPGHRRSSIEFRLACRIHTNLLKTSPTNPPRSVLCP